MLVSAVEVVATCNYGVSAGVCACVCVCVCVCLKCDNLGLHVDGNDLV